MMKCGLVVCSGVCGEQLLTPCLCKGCSVHLHQLSLPVGGVAQHMLIKVNKVVCVSIMLTYIFSYICVPLVN